MSQATVTKMGEFDFNRNVGQVVRTLLHAHRRTVGELGVFLGCSRENAQQKLGGKTKFTAYELRMLADWFGVTTEVFYRPAADLFRPGVVTVRQPTQPKVTAPKVRRVSRKSPICLLQPIAA